MLQIWKLIGRRLCTHVEERTILWKDLLTSPLFQCNHKYALEHYNKGIHHFCCDVEPFCFLLYDKSFWQEKKARVLQIKFWWWVQAQYSDNSWFLQSFKWMNLKLYMNFGSYEKDSTFEKTLIYNAEDFMLKKCNWIF